MIQKANGLTRSVSSGKSWSNARRFRDRVSLLVSLLLCAILFSACTQTSEPGEGSSGVKPPMSTEWVASNVGDVAIDGQYEFVNSAQDDMWVAGAGADIWDPADSFFFVRQTYVGDLDVRARLSDIGHVHNWAKAGLMIRAGQGADEAHALISMTPTGIAEFIRRSAKGATSNFDLNYDHADAVLGLDHPVWVRLVREGETVQALISSDGTSWTEVGSASVNLPDQVLVGVAVSSRNDDVRVEAHVQYLNVLEHDGSPQPLPPPAPEPEPGPGPGPGPGPSPSPEPNPVYRGEWVCPSAPLTPTYQGTVFVATTGSDNNDGRSIDRPLRTLQAAGRMVQPGDVVQVRGGVYDIGVELSRSGTSTAPIVYESYPGECAIFDGSGLSSSQKLVLYDVSHVVFRNFVVRNAPAEALSVIRGGNNVLSNLRLHNNYYSGLSVINSHDNHLSYIISHDNHDWREGGGGADGIAIASGTGNVISHCVTYRNSDDGVDTWLSTGSTVEYCVSFENGFQGGDGNGFKSGGRGATVNTVVRHSIAFANRVNGFDINTGRGVTFVNNTAFGNGGYNFVGDGTTRMQNNISANGNHGLWGATSVSNSWDLGIQDPAFQSTTAFQPGFLALRSNSSAIGVGTPSGTDLGALPGGETIGSWIGIDLARLVNP